jgi:hypothetical protein
LDAELFAQLSFLASLCALEGRSEVGDVDPGVDADLLERLLDRAEVWVLGQRGYQARVVGSECVDRPARLVADRPGPLARGGSPDEYVGLVVGVFYEIVN